MSLSNARGDPFDTPLMVSLSNHEGYASGEIRAQGFERANHRLPRDGSHDRRGDGPRHERHSATERERLDFDRDTAADPLVTPVGVQRPQKAAVAADFVD